MRIIKCDKCKKKIQSSSMDFYSSSFLGEKIRSVEFCKKCAEELGKIIQRFLKAK
ncbi:MAG: hypothetical protein ABIA91_00470 [Patescibacteria group bacterium]